jgi:hypothetical protein
MSARIAATVTALLAAAATAVLVAPAASAAPVPHTVHEVCAQSLYVRAQPAGVVIGTLYRGDNFDEQRADPSGEWLYGHAYGNVHADGWVENGWFC